MVSHAQDVEVLQPVLQHIDQLIVAVRVRGHHEEAMLQNEVTAVTDDPFNDLVVLKRDPDPQSRDDGSMLMKVQRAVLQISIEGLDEKNCLGVLCGNVSHLFGVHQLQPDRIQ